MSAAEPVASKGRGLAPGAVAWLVAGAVLAFAAFLAAMAYQPDLAASADRRAHALSRSPIGYAGVVRLLRADGVTVRMNRRRDPGAAAPAGSLLVLTPPADASAAAVARLAQGRRVLLAPSKWLVTADPRRPGRLAALGVLPAPLLLRQLDGVAGAGSRPSITTDAGMASVALSPAPGGPALPLPTLRPAPVASLRTLGGPLRPVLVDGRGRTVVGQGPGGGYVLSDPDLIDNRALATPDGARAATALLEALADGGPVVFDLTLPGVGGGRSPLRLAFEPPFVAATASFALAVALLGLSARGRFGPVRPPVRAYGFGKRALADSAASLLAVAGREPRLASRYASLARDAAAESAGLRAADGDPGPALDRIGEARGVGAWSELAREAAAVRTRAQLMALAVRAAGWRMEMTRGRG